MLLIVRQTLQKIEPTEKDLQRQYTDINKARNLLEDLLFLTKRADEIKIDGEDKKEIIVKKIREGIHSNHEQEGYLQLAKELNYDAAEKFRAMDLENDEFGEETKKKLNEIKKGWKNVAPKMKPQGRNNWKTLFTRGSSIRLLQRRATGHDDSQLQFSTVGRAASVILAAE